MFDFDPQKADKAQVDYCNKHERPIFAPRRGICYRCMCNIYLPTNSADGVVRGITVERAGSELITSCPHCSYSFVE